MRAILFLFIVIVSFSAKAATLIAPPSGQFYPGVYPGGKTGDEDDITPQTVRSYEKIVGQKVLWVYFSNNWFNSRAFPVETAYWIREMGKIPFIRLMMRSSSAWTKHESCFTLQAIAAGKFDPDLQRWARAARDFGSPLLVEYGTEVNGEWFSWNGRWNGRAEGPKRFIAAFRHIVTLMRQEGATNISWVIHFNDQSEPEVKWNAARAYYPGDDVVDWIGLSCYGPLTPREKWQNGSFQKRIDEAIAQVETFSKNKPVLLLEFGADIHHPVEPAAKWAKAALTDLFAHRWPQICGFSWWNETWENDDNPRHDTSMRVQDSPTLAHILNSQFAEHRKEIAIKPLFRN